MMMSNNPGALGTMNLPTNSSVDTEDLSILVQELRELGFDAIRYALFVLNALQATFLVEIEINNVHGNIAGSLRTGRLPNCVIFKRNLIVWKRNGFILE